MEREGMDNLQTHQHTQCNQEGDNDGWKTVEKKTRKPQPVNNTTTTYYFTDIPPGWNDLALRKTFSKYGRIADVYMAKKKSINGKAFGFARFFNVNNPKVFETTLNSIIIGTENKTDNESDNDSCTNHGENVDDDDGENGEDGDANAEDDDFQDGDDYSPFINEGGWIRVNLINHSRLFQHSNNDRKPKSKSKSK
ncbi:RNA-directed DNA polymerase, eukaryota [Tanacetum coccineum]